MTTSEVHDIEVGWIPDDSTFGARLALVRQKMGWGNVKEAAVACGIAVQSWRTWERDNTPPRDLIRVVERIADRTGADYSWLLAGPRRQWRPAHEQVVTDRAVSDRAIHDTEVVDRLDMELRTPSEPRVITKGRGLMGSYPAIADRTSPDQPSGHIIHAGQPHRRSPDRPATPPQRPVTDRPTRLTRPGGTTRPAGHAR